MQPTRCRIYGPYRNRNRWIVRVRTYQGGKPVEAVESFDTEHAARRHREELDRQLDATDAYRRAAELQASADRAFREAEALAGQRRTVAEAIDAFEMHQRRKGNKPTSVETTRHRLRAVLAPALQEPIVTISERRAADLYSARVASGVAAATHRYELKAARQLWAWLNKQGWAFDNPFAAVEPVGRVRRGKEQLRQREARRFASVALAQARGLDIGRPDLAPRYREARQLSALAVAVTLYLGLRPGETVALTGRDIDDGELFIPDGKTPNAKRRLIIPEPICDLIQRRARAVGDARLFPRSREWVNDNTRRLCLAAGVPVVCAHSLRGLHASAATEAGMTGPAVAAQLGHGSPEITRAHYTRPEATHTARQTAVLRVLGGGALDSAAKSR